MGSASPFSPAVPAATSGRQAARWSWISEGAAAGALALSVTDLARAVQRRQVSPRELVDEVLTRIGAADEALHAIVAVDALGARQMARRLELSSDVPVMPLAGVPFVVKESEPVRGWRCTSGDPAAATRPVEPADSAQVARLRAAGAIPVGSANGGLHGAWAETTNPLFGTTFNPWDTRRIPGGSSGGSAAAVAAGLVPFATGSDGGGSIRIPAAACAIVGFKPSVGAVVAKRHAPQRSELVVSGPMARTVGETAALLDLVAPAHADGLACFSGRIGRTDISGLRIAWSATFGYARPDPRVVTVCQKAAQRLAGAGATVTPVDGPLDHDPLDIFAVLFLSALATEVSRLRGSAALDGLPDTLVGWITTARALTVADIAAAERARHRLVTTFDRLFDDHDVLLSPVTAELPPVAPHADNEWVKFTHPVNLYGGPALSLPVGTVLVEGCELPVGLQLASRRGDDARLLAVAAALEADLGLRLRPPCSSTS